MVIFHTKKNQIKSKTKKMLTLSYWGQKVRLLPKMDHLSPVELETDHLSPR